jgi:hypothetical protein
MLVNVLYHTTSFYFSFEIIIQYDLVVNQHLSNLHLNIHVHALLVNIKFVWTNIRSKKQSETPASYSVLIRSECKLILYLLTMYVNCVHPAMSKCQTQQKNCLKKSRNKRRSNHVQWCPLPRPRFYYYRCSTVKDKVVYWWCCLYYFW